MSQIRCIKEQLKKLEGVNIFHQPQKIRYPNFYLDISQRKVVVEGKEVRLTAREFDLLYLMARHPGRVYTFQQISHMIHDLGEYQEETYSCVYCLISGLRKKLRIKSNKKQYIQTVYGVGYKLLLPFDN